MSDATAPPDRFQRILSRVLAALIVLVAAMLLGTVTYNVIRIAQQWHRTTRYQPVQVTVLDSGLDREPSKRYSYRPWVHYRYAVDGKIYESRRLAPLDSTEIEQSARRMIAPYRAGQTYIGFYNPRDPSQASLLKHYVFLPYVIALGLPLIALMIALPVLYTERSDLDVVVRPAGGGWHELLPSGTLRRRRRVSATITLLWCAVSLIVLGHYRMTVPGPPTRALPYVTTLVAALGLCPAYFAVRCILTARAVGDARLFIGTPRITPGIPFTARVEQAARERRAVTRLAVGLTRDDLTRAAKSTSIRRGYEEWHDHPPSDGPLLITQTLTNPPTAPAPGARTIWLLQVKTRLRGRPDYRARFPLPVTPATSAP